MSQALSATPTTTAPTNLIGLIEAQQALLGLSDHDLSQALGFERQIALTLIKAGTMRLPLTKVPAVAAVLQLDAAELMKVALLEFDPTLGKVFAEVFNHLHLTSTEVTLIKHLRKLSGDTPGAPVVFSGKGVIDRLAV